jgi:pimeloyl-ACP methyl ester carboxylesterase
MTQSSDEQSSNEAMSGPAMIDSTQGVRVALHDMGGPDDPAAPTLLFAHATGFCGQVWEPTAAPLTDRYRCFAIDLRGHGMTETPDGASLHWSHMGDDVLAALDSDYIAGDREVHGIGHSLGCAALVLAAARRPGLLRSLWLYEPAIVGPRMTAPAAPLDPTASADPADPAAPFGASNPMADAALRRRATFASYDEALANFARKAPMNELHPDALAAYVTGGFAPGADGSVTLRCSPATEAEVFRGAGNNEAFAALSELELPVALVAGRPDEYGPVTFVAANFAQLRRGTLIERRHLGHFGPLEDPSGMAADIAAWVEANRSQPVT